MGMAKKKTAKKRATRKVATPPIQAVGLYVSGMPLHYDLDLKVPDFQKIDWHMLPGVWNFPTFRFGCEPFRPKFNAMESDSPAWRRLRDVAMSPYGFAFHCVYSDGSIVYIRGLLIGEKTTNRGTVPGDWTFELGTQQAPLLVTPE